MNGKEFLDQYKENRLPELIVGLDTDKPDSPWFTNDERNLPLQRPLYPV
jgi:hypothetical protein